jgi:hypothetical protein
MLVFTIDIGIKIDILSSMKSTTFYTVKVVGTLWSGSPSTYSKNFIDKPETFNQVKREFGDFDTINDYQVTEVSFDYVTEGKKFITTKIQEIIKDWDNEESEFLFDN